MPHICTLTKQLALLSLIFLPSSLSAMGRLRTFMPKAIKTMATPAIIFSSLNTRTPSTCLRRSTVPATHITTPYRSMGTESDLHNDLLEKMHGNKRNAEKNLISAATMRAILSIHSYFPVELSDQRDQCLSLTTATENTAAHFLNCLTDPIASYEMLKTADVAYFCAKGQLNRFYATHPVFMAQFEKIIAERSLQF